MHVVIINQKRKGNKMKFVLKSLLKVGEKYIVKTEAGEVQSFEYLGNMDIMLESGTISFLLPTDKCYIA